MGAKGAISILGTGTGGGGVFAFWAKEGIDNTRQKHVISNECGRIIINIELEFRKRETPKKQVKVYSM